MTKTRILILLAALSVAFLSGRASVQTTETKIATQEKNVDNTKETVQTHMVTVTAKEPNGTEQTTTTTDSTEQVKTVDTDIKNTQTDKIVSAKSQGINASVLYAPALFDSTKTAIYGVSVTKHVLGPFTIGLFGLTDKTLGLSLGVTF